MGAFQSCVVLQEACSLLLASWKQFLPNLLGSFHSFHRKMALIEFVEQLFLDQCSSGLSSYKNETLYLLIEWLSNEA